MKNIYKQSTALFMALAVFAMIFTGCKKSDANNGGGNKPTPTPENYGIVTLGDQSFTIVVGGYAIKHDDDHDYDYVGIALADRVDNISIDSISIDNINMDDIQAAAIALPYYTTVPSGQFPVTVEENPEQGQCQIAIIINQNMYFAIQGSTTINKNGETYTIDASGSAMSLMGTTANFTAHFTGPLVTE